MKNRFMLVTLSLLLVLGFSIHATAGETYKMGLSLAITGPTSDVGSPYAMGAEDYVKFVNDEKLLGDDKLVCFIRDDGYKTEVTKRNFEGFLDEDIVFYLNYSTGSTMALRQDFQEEKIPVLPASFHAGNVQENDYIFLPIASYSSQAVGLAEYVAANHKGSGKPKVALFLHPSAFGRAPRDDVKKSIELGLAIDLVEIVEHGKDLDNTAMLQRFKSKGVQYVISQTVQPPVSHAHARSDHDHGSGAWASRHPPLRGYVHLCGLHHGVRPRVRGDPVHHLAPAPHSFPDARTDDECPHVRRSGHGPAVKRHRRRSDPVECRVRHGRRRTAHGAGRGYCRPQSEGG